MVHILYLEYKMVTYFFFGREDILMAKRSPFTPTYMACLSHFLLYCFFSRLKFTMFLFKKKKKKKFSISIFFHLSSYVTLLVCRCFFFFGPQFKYQSKRSTKSQFYNTSSTLTLTQSLHTQSCDSFINCTVLFKPTKKH